MAQKITASERRQNRVRRTIRQQRGTGNARLRLSVHRSGQHIYAQVIDDANGTTVAAASSVEKDLRQNSGANKDAARNVGKTLAERAKAANAISVVFDRGQFAYHGRVKELAEAARAAGMQF